MRKVVFLAIALIQMSIVSFAETISFNGLVTDENSQSVQAATVHINNVKALTDAQGKFAIEFPKREYYQVHIVKPGFYERVHHFSHSELNKSSSIKPFELVQRKDKRVMLAFAGDAMMGRRYYKPYFDDPVLISTDNVLEDSKRLLQHVKPYLSVADMAALNLESQLAEHEPASKAKKSVTFYSAPRTVEALKWAGIDYVTLGNNHTYDYLDEGLTSTLKALDAYQLPYSGAGHTEEQALKPFNMALAKQQFALLGYVGWQGSSKIKQTAGKSQGGAAFGSKNNIENAVKKAVKQGQLPIVQYHGSLEYKKEPTGVTEDRLKAAIDAGAVLSIGHHPHVTQGLELYNNKLIAYSMGNFVFDQNFSSTQHSFILYVWLNDGVFERAEIVPIYLKGYKPTPAMDAERISVLNRIKVLSEKRNTAVQNYNGLGVILPSKTSHSAVAASAQYDMLFTHTNHAKLPFANWSEELHKVITADDNVRYRLGTNLVNGSSFEQFNWFDAPERGFLLPGNWTLISGGYQSTYGIKIASKKQSSTWLGMKHFRRVYSASNAMTFSTKVKASQPISINVYWQGRKTRQKLFDAFKSSPKSLIKSISLEPNNGQWQTLEIDFNSPRIGYRSYRVLLEIVNESVEEKDVVIDDFSLIEWQTSYQSQPKPMMIRDDAKMANYIGVNKRVEAPIKVISR